MSQFDALSVMKVIEEIMHDVTQAKRETHVPKIKELAESLGLDPKDFDFFRYHVARWPVAVDRNKTEIRFHVDFGFGDDPDHRLYGATFEEVRLLLNYTVESCRVAFNSTKDNKVDRRTRPTKLGPCVVTKLPEVINPDQYPNMFRLSDKQAERAPKGRHRGNKY